MVSAIQCIFEHEELPISQRLGIISCLPKGDKIRQFFQNWRPIKCIYKMISNCIIPRIRFTLDNLISETQFGLMKKVMKSRYIGENTRFIIICIVGNPRVILIDSLFHHPWVHLAVSLFSIKYA